MKSKFLFIAIAALMLSMFLSGCSAAAMRSNSWAGLSADGENAYLAEKSLVYAIQLDNGELLWQYPKDGGDAKEAFFADPVLTTDGQLLIASAGAAHNLLSLDADNGSLNWIFPDAEGTWIAPPLIVNGTIYAPNTDGKLYALDMEGNFLWAKKIGGPLWSQPVSDGEMLYISSLDHHLYTFDLAKEEVVWQTEISGAAPGSPTLDENGNLYLGSFGAKLEAIDSASHKFLWAVETEGWIWDAPSLDGETLYTGDLEGNIYAINTADGSLLWDPIKPNGTIVSSPLVTEDLIAFGTETGTAYAIDAEGKILWQENIEGRLYTTPVYANDLILFSPMESDTLLVALNLEGDEVWSFTPED